MGPGGVGARGTLVIHPGPLGDVLLAVPALRALRARHSADALGIAAQPALGDLLTALGVVDYRLSFDGLGLEALFVDGGEPADLPALRAASRVICWFGAGDPVFARRLRESAPGAVVASASGDHAVTVWEHLLGTIGAPAGPGREALTVPAALAAAGRAALHDAGWDGRRLLMIVHPGAGGAGKRWPVDAFAAVLDAHRRTRELALLVHEGPADHQAAAALLERLGGAVGVLRGLSLTVLAGALAQAGLYLGNDSGVSHLAAAVGVPSLILFQAATLPWRPWGPRAEAVVVTPSSLVAEETVTVGDRLAAMLRDGGV